MLGIDLNVAIAINCPSKPKRDKVAIVYFTLVQAVTILGEAKGTVTECKRFTSDVTANKRGG